MKTLVQSLFVEYEESHHTAFFVSFMKMVEILTQNIQACRTRNWKEFKMPLKQMLPWLPMYGNTNYGKHLADFLAGLDKPERFMKIGMFVQSMSGNPYSSCRIVYVVVSTVNTGSKLKNGWLAILSNEKQLLTKTLNVNNINGLRNAENNHAGRSWNVSI